MDKTSYSDQAIIDMVNKNFIPIRVDTDKRPDINRRYNMGGWPTTAFLDSNGRIITGGTYIPPQQLREVLRSVLDHYLKNKGRTQSKLEPIRIPKASDEPLTDRASKDIANSIAVNFDIDYGGFGSEPKFPHTDALEYAIHRYRYYGEREMLTVVTRTLEKMARGGMHDHVENGFFRYSTTRDWSIPHFEKMAEDNAKLLVVYLHAFQTTGTPLYRQVAEGIIQYASSNLLDPKTGGFHGSQDADEEYYKLDLGSRRNTLPPKIDKTLYTNYNALFASAYLQAGSVLDRPELGTTALKGLDHILQHAWTDKGLSHFQNEQPEVVGLLADHSTVLQALIDAYEYTADWNYVDRAVQLADRTVKSLYDEKGWGFYDIPESEDRIGELRALDKPLDENSAMAMGLLRLSHITGKEEYQQIAEKTVKVFSSDYEKYGIMAGSYGLALDSVLNGILSITILGSSGERKFEEFRVRALKTFPGKRSVRYLDPSKDYERVRELGYSTARGATCYVCLGKTCGPPLEDPSRIDTTIVSLVNPSQPSAEAQAPV